MDPREQANVLLAQARARSAHVVTPDNMVSPMDASNTQQIPGSVLAAAADEDDPDATTVVPSSVIEEHAHPLDDANPTQPLWQEEPPPQPHTGAEELEGIIPTRTANTGRSTVQSRLEGL